MNSSDMDTQVAIAAFVLLQFFMNAPDMNFQTTFLATLVAAHTATEWSRLLGLDFRKRYIGIRYKIFDTSCTTIKLDQIANVIFVFITNIAKFVMFFQHRIVGFAIGIWTMDTMGFRLFSTTYAMVPWTIPLFPWHFLPT